MTDLAEALAARPLTPFGSKDVIRAGIEIPGAAGGLREAMKFEPVELDHDQEVYVVLHCRVNKVRFDEIKDTEALSRVHVLQVMDGGGALIDESAVKEHIDAQAERIRLAKEKAAGVHRLELDEADEAEVMVRQHNAGVHADERRDACPLCRGEIDAEEAEALADTEADGSSVTPIGDGKPKGRTRKSARGGE